MEKQICYPQRGVRRSDGPEDDFERRIYFFFPLAGAALSAAAAFFSSFFFFCFPRSFLDIAITTDIAKFILNDNYHTVFLDGPSRSSGRCASSQMYREATLP